MNGQKQLAPALIALAVVLCLGCQSQSIIGPEVDLLTADEAAELSLTEAELEAVLAEPPVVLRNTRPGPRIVLEHPRVVDDEDHVVHSGSPTDLMVHIEESRAPVDMNTLEIKARKGMLTKSITDRLRPFVKGTTIEAKGLKLPKGRYRIVVSVADADGAKTVEEYRLVVGNP